jgi:hypothetical protein
MTKRIVVFGLLLTLWVPLFAKKPVLDWHTGTLLSVQMEHGTRVVSSTNTYTHDTTVGSARNDATFYEIDAGDFIYVAKRTLYLRHDRQLHVTTNANVKFALSGDDFYLMDDEGKEHKLTLEEKRAKPSSKDGK